VTTIPDDKPINLSQLEQELQGAGVATGTGLGMHQPGEDEPAGPTTVFLYDAGSAAKDFSSSDQAAVDQVIADHIALRDVTDEEYAAEFQDAATTAARRQEIRDITSGLLPREQVRVDNGQPIDTPAPQADPLEAIKAVPLGAATDELRDAIVAYLERFGG
jgi:hypothetical protein